MNPNLSYWELKNWFTNVDYAVVGSGIVGIHAALRLREKYPQSKILILEKGFLPEGASTKNAGFACFGSLSEILEDLRLYNEEEVIELIRSRSIGLQMLRKRLGNEALDYKPYGGYEIFLKDDESSYNDAIQKIPFINEILKPIFNETVFEKTLDRFGFNHIQEYSIFNPLEGQIDTGSMMQALIKEAQSKDILILNNQNVTGFQDNGNNVNITVNDFDFLTKKLLFANNGFAGQLTNNEVKPARAQVLITAPIENLNIKGTFHIDKGYYYFRNINNRILLGGGRNIDFEGETTSEIGLNTQIQDKLETMLRDVILPNQEFKIAHRWSGIMGMGGHKKPIVKQITNNVYCGVRLSGMGIAIGSLIGSELADLV
jgi:glycine/D-amino acid oxidase-like deaminating enzyme